MPAENPEQSWDPPAGTAPEQEPEQGPVRNLRVYPGQAFRVAHGVNLGEALGCAEDLVMDDVYELDGAIAPSRLAIVLAEDRTCRIAAGSPLGRPGARLHLDHLATFMPPQGEVVELLVMIETDPAGMIAGSYLLPFTPLLPGLGHALVSIDRQGAATRLAQSACVAFTRGTRITMADGRQVRVEKLRPGDMILTRDSGRQELRWIGQQTLRATGAFAPITIAPGALNNAGELTLSPNHRLFVYQRVDHLGAGHKELLVRARDLVNGTSVIQSEGGFVDYFQLLFDKHEIIFAEGIAAESLFIDPSTRPVLARELPPDLAGRARPCPAGHEIGAAEFGAADAVELLRRASLG